MIPRKWIELGIATGLAGGGILAHLANSFVLSSHSQDICGYALLAMLSSFPIFAYSAIRWRKERDVVGLSLTLAGIVTALFLPFLAFGC